MTLEALGIETDAEVVYRSVLDAPRTSVAEVARASRLAVRRVGALLAQLEERGLGRLENSTRAHYSVTPPEGAMQALITQREQDLDRARAAVRDLTERFRARHARLQPVDWIEVVVGSDAVARRVLQIVSGVRHELLVF
ncbi:MAG: hypothetical protein ABR498_06595, partial [Candidatus Dormibacteria bacterium]